MITLILFCMRLFYSYWGYEMDQLINLCDYLSSNEVNRIRNLFNRANVKYKVKRVKRKKIGGDTGFYNNTFASRCDIFKLAEIYQNRFDETKSFTTKETLGFLKSVKKRVSL